MERISTGIKTLDEAIEGGLPKTSSTILYGPAGTMKSIMGLQFLYEGAKNGEPGLMISIEEYDTDFQWYAEEFGWDIPTLQENKLMLFTSYDPSDLTKFDMKTLRSDIIIDLVRLIEESNIKRIVFDSITPVALALKDQSQFRAIIYTMTKILKEKGVTIIYISENSNAEHVEEFITDGIIETFFKEEDNETKPVLRIKKMLATKHADRDFKMIVGKEGVRLEQYFY